MSLEGPGVLAEPMYYVPHQEGEERGSMSPGMRTHRLAWPDA